MRLAIIVPVSPYESSEIILRSIQHIKSLEYGDLEIKIVYVIDTNGKNDPRIKVAENAGIEVLKRESTRGRRGGAINDALEHLKNFRPDYVAIFDVDSRPERNFIIECIKALKGCDKCYIASSKRYINNGINLVSETVEAEYYLINFLLSKSSFKQFNGLIGVLKWEYIFRERLNEYVITEDADFATRMHIKGLRGLLVKTTKLYEQAPLTWRDLFNQRKRWYYGGLQLWRYWKFVKKAEPKFRFSWLAALTLPYAIIFFCPLLLISPFLLLYKYKKIRKIKVSFGLLIETLLLQVAAISALLDFVRKKEVEWKDLKRVVN